MSETFMLYKYKYRNILLYNSVWQSSSFWFTEEAILIHLRIDSLLIELDEEVGVEVEELPDEVVVAAGRYPFDGRRVRTTTGRLCSPTVPDCAVQETRESRRGE